KAGEAGVNVVELPTCVAAGEDADEGGVRNDEVVRREVRPRAACEPDRQQSPVAGHSAGGVLGERTADGVVDQVDPVPAGYLLHSGGEQAVAMIDRCLGSQGAAERRPLLVADDGYDPRAKGVSELDGGDAASTSRSEDGQPVAGCQTAASD